MKPHPFRVLPAAAFAIGTLDLLFAWSFWAHKGVTFPMILQSVARGWYGDASKTMGATSVIVGGLSHYAIMFAFVVAYWWMARRFPALRAYPWRMGALYGLGMFAVMNFVVLPLSAAGMPSFGNSPWIVSSVVMHVVFGILCALTARRASR